MDIRQFEDRKRDHIRHALDPAHQAFGASGLEFVRMVHEALPELDMSQITLESRCLGRAVPTPFYIAAMTAGHGDAPALNRLFASACARKGWGLGVGSQRRDLEGNGQLDAWADLRATFPNLRLYGNVGLSQLLTVPASRISRLVQDMGATAMAVHANALQEGLQPEGTPRFKGGLVALKSLIEELDCPVVLKETGCGFSERTLRRVKDIGLAAVDVSGLGGTHWGRIEGARAQESHPENWQSRAAQVFADWGISTVESVLSAQRVLGQGPVETWASGGVRTGLDAIKLVALGAHQVGFAKSALEAAMAGEANLLAWMEQIEKEARLALFCTGYESPDHLRGEEGAWTKQRT
jgi:isopentenyl-diphosphate delta-isomerase